MIVGWLSCCLHHRLHSSGWLYVYPIACRSSFVSTVGSAPWNEILTQRHQTSVSFELRTGLAWLAWQTAAVEVKWNRPVLFSIFSCYVSLWVLLTRGQPFTWFRCTSVTFPVGQSWAAAGMGFLSTLATFGRYYYSDIELIFYCSLGKFVHFMFYTHSCLPYMLTFSHTTVCPYKAFSTKHYLFKERFKTVVIKVVVPLIVTFVLYWCAVTSIFTVPGTSSHCGAASWFM